jgi:hypothetical protein
MILQPVMQKAGRASPRFGGINSHAEGGGDGASLDFPTGNATVSDMLEWLRTEVQALPTSFAECNGNITCFSAGWCS